MLSIATRSSDRLIRLINDILDIERIRSGKLPMEFGPVEASAPRGDGGAGDGRSGRLRQVRLSVPTARVRCWPTPTGWCRR